MTPLFKKLNWKDQKALLVLNAPASFKIELDAMKEFVAATSDPKGLEEINFSIAFCQMQQDVDQAAEAIVPKLSGDALVWFCYPKAGSKKYKCDFNRDKGWNILGKMGMEPVRQVAIDEDWSALRFRKVEFIKNITRRESFAISQQGKKRTTQKGV